MGNCGIICLLSTLLIANSIVGQDLRLLPESVRWPQKVYNYSDCSRYVPIKCYLQAKACITDTPAEKEK